MFSCCICCYGLYFVVLWFCIVCICFCICFLCRNNIKWVGSGRGRLRPVQNDRTGCPDLLGLVLAKKLIGKNLKKKFPKSVEAAGGGRGGNRCRRPEQMAGPLVASRYNFSRRRTEQDWCPWGTLVVGQKSSRRRGEDG